MTHRERILAAIEHREPDRVPIDLGAMRSTGISAIAYGNLKRHLGIEGGHNRVYDVVQQLALPEDEILDRFGIDAVDFARAFNREDSRWHETTLADGQKAEYPAWFHPEVAADGTIIARAKDGTDLAHMPRGGWFFDQSNFPYLEGYPDDFRDLGSAMNATPWAAFPTGPWDHADAPDFWDLVRTRALALRASTDRAIMIGVGCNLFEWGTYLRRVDSFLMDIGSEPDTVERLLDALMERHMATLENVCRAVGDVVDICQFGDDLGTNSGPFMSPAMYRRHIKPRQAMLCDYLHKHSNIKAFLHSCGSISALLPDMIEAGFDVINPVQTSCRHMEPDHLKREFGRDICFWGGGCDTQRVLPLGTPEEVRAHVLERLEIFAPGGGFVFNTVHNILADVPPRNIVAMYEAVHEFNGAVA
ncbi:uroporphyrinogen decarboxylase family protein [Aquisphaera insulae]|uniref:uroporphyrinogen decarboxylase family protein n=1 Tax=Aquisphaera insulae TaxID=2712864 RepID=UPI0013EB3CDB|nr:uroporphyrinogen decarboxylase family protein [Aquisphaera insulae]